MLALHSRILIFILFVYVWYRDLINLNLPDDLRDRFPARRLPQGKNDLGFCELLLHPELLSE